MRVAVLTSIALMASVAAPVAVADDYSVGSFGADAIFIHPVAGPSGSDSIRAQVSITPIEIDTNFAMIELGSTTVQGAVVLGSNQMELTKVRANALRMIFNQAIQVDVATYIRDLDRGIDNGGEILSLRVPIKITKGGEIVVMPGLDLGVYHYAATDQTSFHGALEVQARAATKLIAEWLSTGIMAKVRYQLDSAPNMSGFEEEAMGYLSFLLDQKHQLYLRVYGGVDNQEVRARFGLPTTDVFVGVGLEGHF